MPYSLGQPCQENNSCGDFDRVVLDLVEDVTGVRSTVFHLVTPSMQFFRS
ncbi:MAG TPA: hypothetical protein VK335_11275 [Bryobacteraceae bacterium]|nr:hypothetical protein [Bryobacteraceae bacterium]